MRTAFMMRLKPVCKRRQARADKETVEMICAVGDEALVEMNDDNRV